MVRVLFSLAAIVSLIVSASVAWADAGYIPYGGQPALSPLQVPAKYLVLMVLDGARPDYFNLVKLPHLDALMAHGTQYTHTMAGILESETPDGHATISTGSTPRRTGILGFSWAENDRDFSLFSPVVVRSGAMEHIMTNAHVPTIAGLFKARYPNTTVVALSGYKYYAADPLGGPQADDILYLRSTLQHTFTPTAIPGHVPPQQVLSAPGLTVPLSSLHFGEDDHLATGLALSAFKTLHQRVTLINYPDFDWPLGHVYGGIDARSKAITLLKVFDSDLGQIEDAYRKAGILNQTLFAITADHGMAPIRYFVPSTVVTNALTAAGATAPTIAYNTATYVWLQDDSKARAVAANIVKAHDPGIASVYYLSKGKQGMQYVRSPGISIWPGVDRANQDLLATLENSHEPGVVVICRKGATTSNPSTHWKADHGGATWGVQHVPLILSGPGIRQGFVSTSAAQLEDVAPTVLADLGVRPTGMEGHVLTEGLTDPFQVDVNRRSVEVRNLQPIVGALMRADQTKGQ